MSDDIRIKGRWTGFLNYAQNEDEQNIAEIIISASDLADQISYSQWLKILELKLKIKDIESILPADLAQQGYCKIMSEVDIEKIINDKMRGVLPANREWMLKQLAHDLAGKIPQEQGKQEEPKCKFAVVSHGIGLSGEVEEISIHCLMSPENDYTERCHKPITPKPEIEPLKVSNDDDVLYRVLAKKLNELIASINGKG